MAGFEGGQFSAFRAGKTGSHCVPGHDYQPDAPADGEIFFSDKSNGNCAAHGCHCGY